MLADTQMRILLPWHSLASAVSFEDILQNHAVFPLMAWKYYFLTVTIGCLFLFQ